MWIHFENFLLKHHVFKPHPLGEWFVEGLELDDAYFKFIPNTPMRRSTRRRGHFNITLKLNGLCSHRVTPGRQEDQDYEYMEESAA